MKYGAKSKAAKRRAATRKLPSRTRRAVRQVVKETLQGQAETKWVSLADDISFNSTITSPGECYPLCPTVPQGVDDFQRLGDSIHAKYLIVRGKVQFNDNFLDVATTQFIPPQTVRVMILSQKNIKVSADVSSRVDVAHLLKDNVNTGAARPYSSSEYDNLAPINSDLFTVHMDKKMKWNWINHQIQAASPATSINTHQVGNDRTRYFYLKIKLDKTLKFDDGNGNYPNSFAPFLCVGAVSDDGSGGYSLTTPWKVTLLSTLYFTDL